MVLAVMAGSLVVQASEAGGAIGDPSVENGWDTRNGVVSIRSSSQHGEHSAERLIDGSGIDGTGTQSSNEGYFLSASLVDSKANPHAGTVPGGHWVEFEFDRPYRLGEMWIWNYNGRAAEYDWRKMGFKNVTIQTSMTGGESPGEWKTVFEGEVPQAESPAPDFLAPVSLVVDLQGVEAKFVVITSADAPEHNWCVATDPAGEISEHGGLNEVRFFRLP